MLVHVSTAYANCDRDTIEERIYPPSVDPDRLANSIGYSYIVKKLFVNIKAKKFDMAGVCMLPMQTLQG